MGTKLVKPEEPSSIVTRQVEALPTLPREEALRIRRASRGYVDVMLPQALKNIADGLISEDFDERRWATDKVVKMAMKDKSNEEIDPEETVVDSVAKDTISVLEEETANVGDGKGT